MPTRFSRGWAMSRGRTTPVALPLLPAAAAADDTLAIIALACAFVFARWSFALAAL
ncbi:MAG: hypothetical protein M3O55_00850 [Actinomycetota bacterium]|nr:hypothetical protein [Actinomycetota bacterium]